LGVKKKIGPKRRGKQGEFARTHTCLKVHPKELVGNGGEVMAMFAYYNRIAWDLGFAKP